MEATVFTDDQLQRLYPDGIENHYWNHARNAIIYRFLKKNRLHEKHILEIGSGRGVVVKYLHDRGLFCIGVEQAAVIPVAGIDHVFYPQTDAFDLAAELKRTISVVMLLDVIEHISNPAEFIQRIIAGFPELSHLVITVPARQELWTNFDQFNGHYKRYNLTDLKSLVIGGMQYAGSGYFNHILYPVFLIYAKWFRERDTNLRAPAGIQKIVHRVLSFILRADYRLLPHKWRGTSAIALYKVPDVVE